MRLDEHEVPSFSWDVYSDTQYPTADTLRYPKAGCNNAKATVCVYDVATKGIQRLAVSDEDCYIPRLLWTDANTLLALKINRDQTKMEVISCNTKSTVTHPIYKESSDRYYIDYSLFDEWKWLSDGRMIVLSEKDGWRRAYLYDGQGFEIKALTPEGIDVTALYAVDENSQTLYYQAAPTPATRQIYAVNIKKGSISQLTMEEGTWSARFAPDAKKAIFCYQSFETPNTYYLYSKNKLELIEDNAEVREAWKANNLPEPELININGLEAMLLKSQQPIANSQQPVRSSI